MPNIHAVNAILYVAEHGCKWRGLPERFGKWYSIYMRANRWAKNGVLDRVFGVLQDADVINIQVDQVSIDSTIVKVHPDGTGALKNGPQAIGKSRGGWTTKIHMVAADEQTAVTFSFSPGQSGDAPEGRELIKTLEEAGWEGASVIMDKAYEGDDTRQRSVFILALYSLLAIALVALAGLRCAVKGSLPRDDTHLISPKSQ